MKLLTLFKWLHFLGLLMFILGLCGYAFTTLQLTLNGILALSVLIGVGLMIMSPYPIVLFLQWAQKESEKALNKQQAEASKDSVYTCNMSALKAQADLQHKLKDGSH
jgi:uncharacterized protein with FMN-binding domain